MAKKGSDERIKTSLDLSPESKRALSYLKADLRLEGFSNATESTILESLILHTSAKEVARIHPKPTK